MSQLFKKQLGASSIVRRSPRTAADKLPCVLRRWSNPAVELARWERLWPKDLVEMLDCFRFADLPRATFRTRKETAKVDVAAALNGQKSRWEDEKEEVISALAMDIESLIVRLSCVTNADVTEVRLLPVCDDACTLLNMDRVRVCLTMTYLGPGTEWVREAYSADAVQLIAQSNAM